MVSWRRISGWFAIHILIAHVPILNVLAIWFVAWQSAAFLSFAGGSKVTLGDTYARPANGEEVLWESWEGNKWFLTEEMSEYSFHTELLVNGEPIFINFVLACTAIQSIIIFVGAISVLEVDWRKRVRALFIALSLIHILNLFRNAGLIWLQMGYPNWNWMNMSILSLGIPTLLVLYPYLQCSYLLWYYLKCRRKCTNRCSPIVKTSRFAPKLRK